MRQFLAVAFLGVTLAFTGSQAFAYGDKVDYVPSHQPAQGVSVVSGAAIRTGSRGSIVAGGSSTTAMSVYHQLREDNRER